MDILKCIRNGSIGMYVKVNCRIWRRNEVVGNDEVQEHERGHEDDEVEAYVLRGKEENFVQDNVNNSKDLEYIPLDNSDIDDGLEDEDFSFKDEEHLKARWNLRWVREHEYDFENCDNNEATNRKYEGKRERLKKKDTAQAHKIRTRPVVRTAKSRLRKPGRLVNPETQQGYDVRIFADSGNVYSRIPKSNIVNFITSEVATTIAARAISSTQPANALDSRAMTNAQQALKVVARATSSS
ncbi:conserved hypothetical protein [Ricinus communis]|uniref:Uncharacterized protein n=1 Tax=Ricinus communis TaxID=3988 RepID=B9SR95_RICCO|nr:conserved hypothetical protein [Ricinus communis]